MDTALFLRPQCPPGALLLAVLLTVPAGAQELLHTLAPPGGVGGSYGGSVSSVPDLDGDGVADLLVGASTADSAFVYSGTDGGLLHALARPDGGTPAWFGTATAGLEDMDDDERGDFAVGSPDEPALPNPVGRVYVFSGATGTLLHTLTSPGQSDRFGRAVAGVPDLDGDGTMDLLVGFGDEDRAYVFSGATGTLLHTLTSDGLSSGFGGAVAGVPDLDGDGVADLLVGASDEEVDDDFYGAGRVYVFSGATGALLGRVQSPRPDYEAWFGTAIAGVPDLDGDGRGDFIVGADGEPDSDRSGRTHVFSGASGAVLYTLHSPAVQFLGGFGRAVAGVPDLDGDGAFDFVVGASEDPGQSPDNAGRVHVFSGADGTFLFTLQSPAEAAQGFFGGAVAGVPDLDGDGRSDLLVGARGEGDPPGAGRAYVFSSAPPDLTLTAAVLNSPVPRGDSLRLAVTLTNTTPDPLVLDLLLDVAGPDGFTHADTLASGLTLPAGTTDTPTFGRLIGPAFPLGPYTGTVAALEGGVTLLGSAPIAFVVTGVTAAEPPPEAPVAFMAPNPTADHAVLRFGLDAPTDVQLTLHDVLGRAVTVVDTGRLTVGTHRLGLDVSALPAGVYVWRLVGGQRIETGRLTVAR